MNDFEISKKCISNLHIHIHIHIYYVHCEQERFSYFVLSWLGIHERIVLRVSGFYFRFFMILFKLCNPLDSKYIHKISKNHLFYMPSYERTNEKLLVPISAKVNL